MCLRDDEHLGLKHSSIQSNKCFDHGMSKETIKMQNVVNCQIKNENQLITVQQHLECIIIVCVFQIFSEGLKTD